MMPAGKYWIGDLCYVIRDEMWDFVCSNIEWSDGTNRELVLPDGVRIALYGTQWGDGGYDDNVGNSYGVDSGTIGIMPYDEVIQRRVDETYGHYSEVGHVHEFKTAFNTSAYRGMISFGDIQINTDYEGCEEDEEDEE